MNKILGVLNKGLERIGDPFADTYIRELLKYLYHTWSEKDLSNILLMKIVDICGTHEDALSLDLHLIWVRKLIIFLF